MDWRVVLLAFLATISADKEVLLDTSKLTTELSKNGWRFPAQSKWQDVSSFDENGETIRVLQVCELKEPNQDNWVESPFISTRGASQVELEIKFAIRSCSTTRGNSCREKFTVYMQQSSAEFQSRRKWAKVDTIAELGSASKTFSLDLEPASTGLYIAFQDGGSCSIIQQVKLSFNYCPRNIQGFAVFPRTVTAGRIINVSGQCIGGTERQAERPVYHCGPDGDWSFNIKQCKCMAGFESDENQSQCNECLPGSYKNQPGAGSCIPCPLRTDSNRAAAQCQCDVGTFRLDDRAIDDDCFPPPEPMVLDEVNVTRSDSKLAVKWSSPVQSGQLARTYRVKCYECSEAENCRICPRSIKLPPPHFGAESFDLYGLSEVLDYKIEIIAENEISAAAHQAGIPPAVTTLYSEKILKEFLRVVDIRQLAVDSEEAKFMINHEPDTMLFDKINIKLNGILRQLRQSEPEFTMQYLAAETVYEMIVSITADGIDSAESEIVKFTTPKAKTALNLSNATDGTGGSWIAGIITGIALIVICVIIFVFIIFRHKHHDEWTKGARSSVEQFSVATTSSGQGGSTINATVDLIPCRAAVPVELNAAQLEIGTFLATGRLGKVTYGQYQARAVAIKHLSHFNFELSDDYMKQIVNWARLDQVNVLKIEGLLTKSYPHLIVMEEAAYPLKAFFAHQSPKTEGTLISAMRDCAQGLAYLHLNRIILRHLDADHVMVCPTPANELIFKLRPSSKFTLAPTEEQSADQQLIENECDLVSIRLVAPEVLSSSRFTPESDIWSLGVLTWTILSNDEPLYWGLSDGQVLSAVRGGWRLPLPQSMICAKKETLHAIMLQCWEARPQSRPRAKEVQFKFEQILVTHQNSATDNQQAQHHHHDQQDEDIPGIPV